LLRPPLEHSGSVRVWGLGLGLGSAGYRLGSERPTWTL